MTEAKEQKVRVISVDEAAVAASVWRLEKWICALFGLALFALCAIFFIWASEGSNAMFGRLLKGLCGTWFVVFAFIYLVAPSCLRGTEVLLGDDSVAGPDSLIDPINLFLRRRGYKVALAYRDIRRVNLDVAKGGITGATVVGKGGVLVLVKRVTDPVAVIRAIREHTGPDVTWRRSFPPWAKLSSNEVDAILDRSGRESGNVRCRS